MNSHDNRGYRGTLAACFMGYITHACSLNFLPLLFLTLQSKYGISLAAITGLVTVSFAVQLVTDGLMSLAAGRVNVRVVIIAAHLLCVFGMAGLAFLPELAGDPYIGLLSCVILYSAGGGVIEVLLSPIVESCPTKNKPAMMSLLHSFFSWGSLLTVVLSTLFFVLFGQENYPVLACLWAAVPLFDAVWFLFVPICEDAADGFHGANEGRRVLRDKRMWYFLLLMFCAGAAEQAMAQWASAFAENALGVTKTLGDLAGPSAFALLMGVARVGCGFLSGKLDLQKIMLVCAALCAGCYLAAALIPFPAAALAGCGLCGFAVGIMWPGTYSLASRDLRGGTAMFALLALAGDLGCGAGPAIVGYVSSAGGDDLSAGLLAGAAVPILLTLALALPSLRRRTVR